MPEDRINYLREAFAKIMSSETFIKQIKVRYPIWTTPDSGDKTAKIVKDAMSLPEAQITELGNLTKKYLK